MDGLTWQIQNNSHNDPQIRDYIGKIFEATLAHFVMLGFVPPLGVKPVVLIRDCNYGPIVYWPLKPEKYEVGICIDGYYPHQIIFQAAHELCHIFIDPRITGPIIEIICHKTALDVLEDIGVDVSGLTQEQLDKYIDDIKCKSETAKDNEVAKIAPTDIITFVQELEKNGQNYDREMNNLIAFKLKELFDSDNKYSIIKEISSAVVPQPPQDLLDLNTNDKVVFNPDRLIENLKFSNPNLSKMLELMHGK